MTSAVTGTEEQALAAGGGPELLVPGYPWQVEQLADTLLAYAATLADAAASLARTEVVGWSGAAATAAHTRLGQEPVRWSTAASAFETAASALLRYAAAFDPARRLAVEAAELYERYVGACQLLAVVLGAADRGAGGGVGGVGGRLALLLAAGSEPATHDAAWSADALRRAAVETLARARAVLETAGDEAALCMSAALAEAPSARTFWQGTIRPPGAEETAHHGLDGLSFVPGWVGGGAALLNAGWYLAEGRRSDAAWAAAAVVPFAGKGLKQGLVALEAADGSVGTVRAMSGTYAATVASGHAWTKHVVKGGEFPGVTSQTQFADLVADVVLTGEARVSTLYPGKTYYWKDGTFVVLGPRIVDGGTAFRPTTGYSYFLKRQ